MTTSILIRHKKPTSPQTEEMWDSEYIKRQALPSTLATGPSRCLSRVADLLPDFENLKVLDIGCGNGRHAKFFAQRGAKVHALDLSGAAIEICKKNLESNGITKNVSFHHKSCLDFLPTLDGGFDIVLDSYMSCHLTEPDERAHLFLQVHNVLAPTGLFLSFGISPGDAYYAQFAGAGEIDGSIVVDQLSKIPKKITSSNFLRKEYIGLFEIVRSEDVLMRDRMGPQSFDKAAVLMAVELRSNT